MQKPTIQCDSPSIIIGSHASADNPAPDINEERIFRDGYINLTVRLAHARFGMDAGHSWLIRYVSARDTSQAQSAYLDGKECVIIVIGLDEVVEAISLKWAQSDDIGMYIAVIANVRNELTGGLRHVMAPCTADKVNHTTH